MPKSVEPVYVKKTSSTCTAIMSCYLTEFHYDDKNVHNISHCGKLVNYKCERILDKFVTLV